jgi:hypothetical protein
MRNSIKKPAAAPPPKLSRTELDALVRQREALNVERLALDRQSADLKKRLGAIDQQLVAIVDAEATGGERKLSIKSFVLSIVQRARSVSWKSEFVQRHPAELVAQLEAAAGSYDRLEIVSRE